MSLQPWELLVVVCAATGVVALIGRHGLRWWGQRQVVRLSREALALERWWVVIAELPVFCLEPGVRRTIGQVMHRRLDCARRLRPDHPFLRAERIRIARFIGQSPGERTAQSRDGRARTLQALRALLELLQGAVADRLLERAELSAAEAAIARQVTELEFLQNQPQSLEAEYLRRVTRAIGTGAAPPGQLGASSSALPTQ